MPPESHEGAIAEASTPPIEEEKRPKTDTELFIETRALFVFRARQIVEIMRTGKDVIYDQMVRVSKCETRDTLEMEQFHLADGVASICDILHRFNAGIMTTQKHEEKSNIEVVKG